MNNPHRKPAGWQIHPTVNNSLSPLCLLPSSPNADAQDRKVAAMDTISRASQALASLADKLETDEHYGDRLMLNCVCGALFHASELLKAPDDERAEAGTHEIELLLSGTEKLALNALARQANQPVEDFAASLVMEQLAHRLKA